jgi:hypothetical protein
MPLRKNTQNTSIGVSDLALIRDQRGGAVTVEFADMTTEELRQRCWAFPEARAEYLKRFVKKAVSRLSG